jgi:GrpB-like predicted nucleotidyltransferase (UPF0157 family)
MPDPAEPRQGPKTEEDMRAAWVVEPPKLAGKVQLADYDPDWPRLFQREADRIRRVLGERVVQLEHVGSTSVPGLAAKPIIDIQISVADLEPLAAFRQPLERLGYVYRADNPERTKRYFREPPGRARTLCTCAGG